MRRYSQMLAVVSLVVWSSSVRAQTLRAGTGPSGQPGVFRTLTATPAIAGSWALAAGAGYSWDPDVIVEGDARYQAGARFALGYSPWSFLTFSLSADGLIDAYQWSGATADSLVVGAFGNPRIGIRTGIALGAGFSLGGAFELWIPSGRGAFSVEGASLSPSADLLVSFTPERIPLGVHLDLGYRHDRSSLMLGSVAELIPEQLLLAGATSAQHHLSIDFALEYRIGRIAPYLETSASIPLGAEGGGSTSVLVGLGARAWLGPGDVAQIYLGLDFRVTDGTPTLDISNELFWTAPPLLNLQFGVVFRLPVPTTEHTPVAGVSDRTGPNDSSRPNASQLGRIAGAVRCGADACGVTTRVVVSESGASAIAPDDESGRFTTAELAAGTYTIEVTAEGRQMQRQQVEVTTGAAEVSFDLQPAGQSREGSRIQGQVTDFQGRAVPATILIPALSVEIETDAEGRFEIEADPGRYDVVVSASGYRTQHSRVQVRLQETVVMNVELRAR